VASALFAAADAPSFRESLYPVLQKANCRSCHVDNGVASGTRLHLPELEAQPDEVEAFGKKLAVLVDRQNPGQSLLLNKPTNRIKHTGGLLIAPGSREEAILIRWIEHLATLPHSETAPITIAKGAPAPVLMRRLTHSQYNNTVRDLLGDHTNPANQFPQEDFVSGFKNQTEAQGLPPLLAEAYSAAAERIARSAFRMENNNPLIPCTPRSARDRVCRGKFVRRFGLRAFRRPLNADELARYMVLFDAGAAQSSKFSGGAQLVVEAMLQSPHFLFRVEKGANGYAVASRLSYALWDTMPDDELFRSAAAGELSTPAGIQKAARRMLNSGPAKQALDEFVSQWLRFDRILNTVKDRELFPMFTPELALSMTEESRRLIADHVWNDRNFMNIFNARFTFLNSDLASLYKMPASEEEFAKVEYPTDSERAGILGQAAFLALTSKPADTSPTARGLFVREQFLCQHVPDPPPGTNSNLPPLTEAKPRTNRDRLAVHLTNASCAACHKLIDPIGYGFERFDAVGGYREKLKLTFFPTRGEGKRDGRTVELPLDTSGSISGIQGSEFSSPKGIGDILAGAPECQECIVKQYFRYTYGRPETMADRPVIQAAFQRFRNSQFNFKEVMISVITAHASQK
jgi:hypothetical protein